MTDNEAAEIARQLSAGERKCLAFDNLNSLSTAMFTQLFYKGLIYKRIEGDKLLYERTELGRNVLAVLAALQPAPAGGAGEAKYTTQWAENKRRGAAEFDNWVTNGTREFYEKCEREIVNIRSLVLKPNDDISSEWLADAVGTPSGITGAVEARMNELATLRNALASAEARLRQAEAALLTSISFFEEAAAYAEVAYKDDATIYIIAKAGEKCARAALATDSNESEA